MKIKKGTTRIVFVFKNIVIKIPNYTYSHLHFLNGCYANYSERNYCIMFKDMPEFYNKVAPTIYSSIFGLFSIQRKVEVLNRELTEEEAEYFKNQSTDNKGINFGIYNGRLVCIDYN